MSKVSTLTSCFGGEKYLKLFLDELPNQTIFDQLEFVISHNEPSEIETALIEEYKNQHDNLNRMIEESVIPLYVSWNKCIEQSTSEYICVWNIDDLRTPDSLEVMVDALDKNSDIDFVYGNFMIVNSFGSKDGRLVNTLQYLDQLKTGMIIGPFFMFRRSILEKCGMFDEQFKSGGDYDFAMRLVRAGKGLCLPNISGYYLDEGKGLSTGSELQPIERTVIERRYNLKITEPKYIEKTNDYDLENIIIDGIMTPVKEFI